MGLVVQVAQVLVLWVDVVLLGQWACLSGHHFQRVEEVAQESSRNEDGSVAVMGNQGQEAVKVVRMLLHLQMRKDHRQMLVRNLNSTGPVLEGPVCVLYVFQYCACGLSRRFDLACNTGNTSDCSTPICDASVRV